MNPAAHKEAFLRAQIAREAITKCRLCPRNCGVDRTSGQKGFCRLDGKARIYREFLYDEEEEGLNPSHLVCFSGCNLKCNFCTVSEWNEKPNEAPIAGIKKLKSIIEKRIKQGAKTLSILGGEPSVNIHFVLELLALLKPEIKVVWNTNMYYNQIVGELIDGLADIYLPDFKAGNNRCAKELIGADDYFEAVTRNIMRVKDKGRLIIRHVILPGHTDCCLKPILSWIAGEMPSAVVSLRGNYFPPADAKNSPRGYLSMEEFQNAMQIAGKSGINLVK
jgi:putative pyruvate formate lyase activating enzyme